LINEIINRALLILITENKSALAADLNQYKPV
jgi:hypothetical protein